MHRIKALNRYQKGVLLIMTIMTLIFAVIYPKTISRVGFRYNDAILIPTQENGNTLYSGRIHGKPACFTVSDHKTVVFQHGDTTYGPYTVTDAPDAVPKDHDLNASMTGIEVLEGEEILFRGGILDSYDFFWLYSEDGTSDSMIQISYSTGDGIERDENGLPIDRMKPSVSTIYELTNSPQLTHKGTALGWFGAAFICILNAISILFADELFLLHLSFQIRDAEYAEPSDWVIAGRYISWTILPVIALCLFMVGLR